jgi:hypothetical protein
MERYPLVENGMAMHPAEPPLIRNPYAASRLNIFFWKGREVNIIVCKLV